MSWFSGFTTALQEVTEQVAESAKNALPIDAETLEKLTLTTPELSAERKQIDEEENRKEHIKDCLAGMLPWETRDPERDILVEECKEAILTLSKEEATFKGPYLVPGLAVKLTASKEKQEGGEEDDVDEEEAEAKKNEDEKEMPSEESLEKLSKLEPLPKLLEQFDLDAHVGLIQRLLSEDPHLVKMQSKLSGGGEREHYFWKNFFFHCAYARYEAGLSIDEIWSDEDPMERKAKQEEEKQAAADKAATEQGVAPVSASEEEITFDNNEDTTKTTDETAFASPEPETEVVSAEVDTLTDDPSPASVVSSSAADSSANGFENISSDNIIDDDDAFGDDGFDVELDELEAEIARELED